MYLDPQSPSQGSPCEQVGFLKRRNNTYTDTLKERLQLLIQKHCPSTLLRKGLLIAQPLEVQEDLRLGTGNFQRLLQRRPAKTSEDQMGYQILTKHISPVLLQKGIDVLLTLICKIFRACLT